MSKGNKDIDAGFFDETYKDLFLGYKGMMHLSSSSEGELAWSNDNFGGFFTYHFIKEGLIKKPVKDWNAIFSNAKDKTSQMFMRLPIEDRSKLAKEGVRNQTAKAFSMPTLSKGTNVVTSPISDNNQNNTNNNQNNKVPGKIILYNFTKQSVNFYIDNNDPSKEWLPSKTQQKSVGTGKKLAINKKDGRTLLVLSELYPSKEALDAAGTGAADAMGEMFQQLDELLANLGASE